MCIHPFKEQNIEKSSLYFLQPIPEPPFKLSETQRLFHCSPSVIPSMTLAHPCMWHIYSLDLLAATPSRVAWWYFLLLESCQYFHCWWGIYHISVSFLNRNFQQFPTVLFPQEEAILFFSIKFRTRKTANGTVANCLLVPLSSHVHKEWGVGEGMCKKQNWNQKASTIISAEGHRRSPCLMMSFHREAKVPAKGTPLLSRG